MGKARERERVSLDAERIIAAKEIDKCGVVVSSKPEKN